MNFNFEVSKVDGNALSVLSVANKVSVFSDFTLLSRASDKRGLQIRGGIKDNSEIIFLNFSYF